LSGAEPAKWPAGVNHLFTFFVFNFLSVMIVMDSPIFLYVESLGASATVMGVIAGLTPLMVVFQLPAADHVNRVGYKRFITTGWTVRLLFIAGLAIVPFLGGAAFDDRNKLAMVLAMLFLFNLVRGISSCGWYPWITGLIPEKVRGRYLTIENACNNVGSLLAFLLVAFYLGSEPEGRQFGMLFLMSLGFGLVSLIFIFKVPEVPAPQEEAEVAQAVPWGEIVRHPPFRKLLWVAFAWAMAMGGLMAFLVKFLKADGTGMADNQVMLASSSKFVGGLLTLWFLSSRLDRMGSRPVMHMAIGLWAVILAGWTAMAGGALEMGFGVVLGLHLAMGFGFSMFGMALSKLAMATVPKLGRSHFFALFSVVGSLTAGLFPIVWGLLIDILRPVQKEWLGLEWNQFSIYFAGLIGVLLGAVFLVQRLEEEKAARMDEFVADLVRNSPLRYWLRD
tara:strand:- start:3188 stop:4531 length:1344 start_codon:yes stop_codon:yes gene_type:complete